MTIVPTRAMQLIERAIADGDAEVQLAVRGNEVLVHSPRATIYSRLARRPLPRVAQRVPAPRTSVSRSSWPSARCYSAVRQAAIVTSEESRGVDFTFGGGTLVLAGRAAEVGQSRVELPIGYDGAGDRHHARPAVRHRFPQGARPRKNVHARTAKTPKAPPSAPPTTATAT